MTTEHSPTSGETVTGQHSIRSRKHDWTVSIAFDTSSVGILLFAISKTHRVSWYPHLVASLYTFITQGGGFDDTHWRQATLETQVIAELQGEAASQTTFPPGVIHTTSSGPEA